MEIILLSDQVIESFNEQILHLFCSYFFIPRLVGSKSTANQRAINVNAPEEISFDQMTMFTLVNALYLPRFTY